MHRTRPYTTLLRVLLTVAILCSALLLPARPGRAAPPTAARLTNTTAPTDRNEAIIVPIGTSGFSLATLAMTLGQAITWRNETGAPQVVQIQTPTDLPDDDEPTLPNKAFLPVITQVNGATAAAQEIGSAHPLDTAGEVTIPPGQEVSYTVTKVGEYRFQLRDQASSMTATVGVPDRLVLFHIGNQQATLGSTLALGLQAYDPEGAPLRFNVAPLPLPDQMSLQINNGRFAFRPTVAQTGSYTLTFSVTDGQEVASETVRITVPTPPTGTGSTSLRGRILDANTASQNVETPLVGATVRLVNNRTIAATTDSAGYFELAGLDGGEQYVEFDGSTATPAGNYGAYRSKQVLIANVANVIDRPIYIMAIDMTGQTMLDPNSTITVNNPNVNTTIVIPPQTVRNDAGDLYSGPISISEVPADFTPSSLPGTLDPGMVLTIQPMGLTFAQPAPITLPNIDNLPAGSEVDIWSMDHETAQFFIAGKGVVSADGARIETIEGGIREASWHFPMSPMPGGQKPPGGGENNIPSSCQTKPAMFSPTSSPYQPFGSKVHVGTGCLETSFQLPSYTTLGAARSLSFVYKSDRAYPRPFFAMETILSQRAAVPNTISYRLDNFAGVSRVDEVYISTDQFDESRDEALRGVIEIDGTTLETGVYPYSLRVTSNYQQSNVSTDLTGIKIVLNERDSAFGSGWGLAGLQRLYPQETGKILLTNGSGSALLFTQANTSNVRVDGKANIFGAGRQIPPDPGGGGGGVLPPGIPFSSTLDAVFTFPTVTGEVTCNFTQPMVGPDGGDCYNTNGIDILSYQGISGIHHQNRNMFLVGVFLGSDAPQDPAPERLRFAAPSDFTELRPALQQTFFIGDGYTSNGELQRFYAPSDASRLYLGIADAFGFQELPGYYDDNAGSFDVEINLQSNSPQNNEFLGPEGDFSTITKAEDGTYTRRLKDGTTYTFNAAGYQTAMTDRNGNRTTYSYDANDRLISISDPTGQTTNLSYVNGKLSTIADPQQRTTAFTHDGAGNLTQVTYPDGSTQRFGYDNRHLMTSETDARGQTTYRQYNQWGQLVNALLPGDIERGVFTVASYGLTDRSTGIGTETNPAPVTRPDDAVGQIVDGEGRTTRYTLGPVGYPATVTDPAGFTTTIARDEDGNPLRTQLPSGVVFTQRYDARGNLLSTLDQTVNGTTSYVYEPTFNQVTSSTDPLGNVTSFTYDATGNLTKATTPLQRTVQMAYNSQGLPTTLTDPLGTPTIFTYDAAGNPTTITNGSGATQRTTTLSYTLAGYPATLTDPLGNGYSYSYDDFGRITQETLPGARTVAYGYDADGNLTAITPPSRPVHTFTYDSLGQVIAYTPPAVNGVPNPATTYAYNKAQQPTQITRPDGKTLVYSYDGGGRLNKLTFSRGDLGYSYSTTTGQLSGVSAPGAVELAYAYNGELLTGVTWRGPVNGSVGYTYDANYRMTQDTVNGNAISYSYDADDSLTQAGDLTFVYTATNGLLSGSTLGTINDRWRYNQFGEPTGYDATGNGASLYAVRYDRDKLGRIATKTETVGGVTTTYRYRYDAAQRLDQVERDGVVVEAYSYDANGNRLTGRSPLTGDVTGSYDEQDRLLQYGAATYSYTANGELLTKTENGQTTNYSYDELGNLTAVTLPDGTQITYLLDGQNRRIGKQVNGVLVQGLLYQDQLNPIAEVDGAGNLVSRFVYGNRVNVPEYMVKAGVTYRLITDHLGSVRLVVNAATGEVVQRIDYDAFGNALQDTNPGFQPFGFAGGIYDSATGLVRFGARDYAPVAGRWTAKDPIGFGGGDANLYGYVRSNVLNASDPRGLDNPGCDWVPEFCESRCVKQACAAHDWCYELYNCTASSWVFPQSEECKICNANAFVGISACAHRGYNPGLPGDFPLYYDDDTNTFSDILPPISIPPIPEEWITGSPLFD